MQCADEHHRRIAECLVHRIVRHACINPIVSLGTGIRSPPPTKVLRGVTMHLRWLLGFQTHASRRSILPRARSRPARGIT